MAKNPIPVRQDPSDIRGSGQTGLINIGEAAAALPTVPTLNPGAVALQIRQLSDQAQRVLDGANRMTLVDDSSASVATDFLKAIAKRVTEVDDARKAVSGGFDTLVKGLNALYNTGPAAKLKQAKDIVTQKLTTFALEQRRKAEEAAQRERERIAAEAAAQAQRAVDDGDTEAALEILESASQVEVKAEAPAIRGGTAVLAGTKRKVGKVTDLRKFLSWAGSSPAPMALAVVGGIEVGQKELNQLAAAVIKANDARKESGEAPLDIPGFEASYAESFGAR